MKYHGLNNIEEKRNYISDFSISEDESTLTIVTEDGKKLRYEWNKENKERLEKIYNSQSDVAIKNIPSYKLKRKMSQGLALATVAVAGTVGAVLAETLPAESTMTIVSSVGTITLCAEALIYGKYRIINQKLEEAIRLKALKKQGPAIVQYMKSSENAFVGFSDERKQELLNMIDEGMDPISILEIDGAALTTDEIRKFNENRRLEAQYKFTKPPTAKRIK